MKRRIMLLTLGLIFLNGCAMAPSKTTLAALPVIEFGETAPADGNFILHFPAGKNIPNDIGIEGDIFEQTSHHVLNVKLNRDIYTYKNWISYDNKKWIYGQDALAVKLDIKIPGYDHPKPGHINISLSEKK